MAEGPCTRVKQSGSYRSPSCLPNGYYAPTQCYPKDKVCHCSHPDGTPVHGTDIFFKNDHDVEKFQCTVDEETGTLKGWLHPKMSENLWKCQNIFENVKNVS